MPKVGSKKNFGWGAKPLYAGRNAIRDYYGKGRFATVAAHNARWAIFCRSLGESGIKDTAEVTTESVIDFAAELRKKVSAGRMTIAYATNLISSVNIAMKALRGDEAVKISPREHVGSRIRVRKIPPKGMDKKAVWAAADEMREMGYTAEAAVIVLCREIGLRKKEGCLIDAKKSLQEALKFGRVNVTRGTKGGRGRTVDRWVDIPESVFGLLLDAAAIQGAARSLVPPASALKQFIGKLNKAWETVRGKYGLGPIHDLRASFACELYECLTGYPAPVTAGKRLAPDEIDDLARQIIAHAMGHFRKESAAAYIGTRRST